LDYESCCFYSKGRSLASFSAKRVKCGGSRRKVSLGEEWQGELVGSLVVSGFVTDGEWVGLQAYR